MQWGDVKPSQWFSNYATHKSFTLTWAQICMKLGVNFLKKLMQPKVQPIPAGCEAQVEVTKVAFGWLQGL